MEICIEISLFIWVSVVFHILPWYMTYSTTILLLFNSTFSLSKWFSFLMRTSILSSGFHTKWNLNWRASLLRRNPHLIVIRNLGGHLIERHVVKDNSRIAYNLCRPLPRSPSLWVELSSTGVSVCRLLHIASTNRWYVSRVSSSWLMMVWIFCSEYVAGWSSISRSWRTLFKHALVQQMSGYASEKERQIGQMGGKTAQNRCFLQKNGK